MKRVRLVVPDGDLVAEVSVPEFVKGPDVIVWGVRAFFPGKSLADLGAPDDDAATTYVEGFMYCAPVVEEGE